MEGIMIIMIHKHVMMTDHEVSMFHKMTKEVDVCRKMIKDRETMRIKKVTQQRQLHQPTTQKHHQIR